MHKSKLICVLAVILIATFAFTAVASAGFDILSNPSNQGRPEFVPGEVLVKMKSGADVSSFMGKHGLALKKKSKHCQNVYSFRIPPGWTVNGMADKLKNDPDIEYAEPNYYYYAMLTPNDPYLSLGQWHISRINCEAAWDTSTGSGVVVAIIDSGVDHRHPDLAGTTFDLSNAWDFVDGDSDCSNGRDAHGTHVAGTVAQTTNNNEGCAGVAFDATILPVRVLNDYGWGTEQDIADGIQYAADTGAKVLNMSLGGSVFSQLLLNACNYAYGKGCVIVCAAGNDSSASPHYPAAYDVCISVSATNYNNGLASYSNFGDTIDICAPGGDLGDYNGDGYDDFVLQGAYADRGRVRKYGYYLMAGTSMAAPHVAGTAALVWANNPDFSNDDVRCALESTATDLGAEGWDQSFGHGLVNAAAALTSVGCTCVPSDEVCDGLDNDCDGLVDEGFDVGAPCSAGTGACQAIGIMVCTADGMGTECNATPGEPSDEICDGVDNNCDGSIDEDLTRSCLCDETGTETCINGQWDGCEIQPEPEVCDGQDNDCDGLVDEDFDIGESCTVGVGACQAIGIMVCTENGMGTECNATPGVPSDEICDDNIDNDCDGAIDSEDSDCSSATCIPFGEPCSDTIPCCSGKCHPKKGYCL